MGPFPPISIMCWGWGWEGGAGGRGGEGERRRLDRGGVGEGASVTNEYIEPACAYFAGSCWNLVQPDWLTRFHCLAMLIYICDMCVLHCHIFTISHFHTVLHFHNLISSHKQKFSWVYDAVSASVIIWVPKLGENKTGQMVSEKMKWA